MAALAIGFWQYSRARCLQIGAPIICHVDTTRPMVALSFDDGPTPQGLDAILPVLRDNNAHATFFLIGSEIDKHPGLARRIANAGHEIGNHSYYHRRDMSFALLSTGPEHELQSTSLALRHQGLARPKLFRPPYGRKSPAITAAVERQGLTTVTWSFEEPSTSDPKAYARSVIHQAKPGSIILIHAMYRSNQTARAALPLILRGLTEKGLRVVSVSDLMAAGRTPG